MNAITVAIEAMLDQIDSTQAEITRCDLGWVGALEQGDTIKMHALASEREHKIKQAGILTRVCILLKNVNENKPIHATTEKVA